MGSKSSRVAEISTSPEIVENCAGPKVEESCNCVICGKEFKKPYERDTPIVRGPCSDLKCEKKFRRKAKKMKGKPIIIAPANSEDVKVEDAKAEDAKAEDVKEEEDTDDRIYEYDTSRLVRED